jgi:DNA polymerase I-like protein with 3'-5' exonuclease and polymerase domains
MADWSVPAQLPDLRRIGIIALDTETRDERLRADMGSGWPFRSGHLCGISVAFRAEGEVRGLYFPIRHPDSHNFSPEQIYQWVRDHVAADVHFVTQNGLYDFGWLRTEAGIRMPSSERLEEIGALATMVDENRFEYSLEALCIWRGLPGKDETLLHQGIEALGLIENKRKKVAPQNHLWQLPARYVGGYAETDAINTLLLYESLDPILDQEGTRAAYRLECDILPMVLEMRLRGIRVDLDAAERARDSLLRKRDVALAEISEKLGCAVSMHEIQGKKWLVETFDRHRIKYPHTEKGNPSFTAGKTGWMTGHVHWLPPLIATANKYNKAVTDFLQKLIDYTVNGRIHAEINPHRSEDNGTKSFRFSYNDPPLQQMPSRDEELAPLIRGVFLPEEGEFWAKPDASQQEFRFVVHYASQHKLRKAAEAVARYREDPDTDYHVLTAAMTKLDRAAAKNINFGKIYGIGIRKFAEQLGKPLAEAEKIYEQYNRELPYISQLDKLYRGQAHRQGYITLYDGARRHFNRWAPGGKWKKKAGPCEFEEAQRRLKDSNHPWYRRGNLYRADARTALNALIQGSAARHTKLWMRACWRENIVPLLQMHDCLDCSVSSRKQAELVARLGCEVVQLDVPMRVDLKYGRNWGDAKHTWEELHGQPARPEPTIMIEAVAGPVDDADVDKTPAADQHNKPQPITEAELEEINRRPKEEGIEPLHLGSRSENPKPQINIFRDAALDYAARGWAVFPVPPGSKKSHKSAEHSGGMRWGATSDPDEIRLDWARWPDAGVGIITGSESGIFVLDADTLAGHGIDGLATIAALEQCHGRLPTTLMAESPSGSLHRYFRHPGNGRKITCAVGKLGPGVDVLGDNGMIVAPPSVRPGKGQYRWLNDLSIAEAPIWLLELVQEQPREHCEAEPQADIERVTAALDAIPNADVGWSEWNRIGMAAWRATGGSEEGYAAFEQWSAKSSKHDAETTRERWQHYFDSPPTEIGAGTLFYLANSGGHDDASSDDDTAATAEPPKGNGGAISHATHETIEPVNLWGQFDPPQLPTKLLPDVIEQFAREEGDLMGADPAGLAVAALAVCAAALPDHTQLQVKKYDVHWLEAARLWVGLIGDPSTKKSPIIQRATKQLKRLDAELWREFLAAKECYDELSNEERKQVERPKQRRLRLEDTTIEAAQEVLKDSPDGVLCIQDELSGWFGAMDKYAGRGAAKDRGFWLQSFHGGPYAINRIARGSAMIENLSVSLLGGIQPDPIRRIADDTIDDGLLQRLIPIVLRRGWAGKDVPISEGAQRYDALVEWLHERKHPGALLRFDDAALKIRQELEQKHLDLMACEVINRKLAAHIGKYDGLFARLCVLWHCIEGVEGLIITEHTARRVANFMHRFLLPHATAFYAGMLELSDNHDRLTKVAGYILAKRLQRVTNRDVQHGNNAMRGLERREIENIFDQLEALGWLFRTPGLCWSAPPQWLVNPEVHRRFAERASREAVQREQNREMIREIFGASGGGNQ